jgi:hypothetical protein
MFWGGFAVNNCSSASTQPFPCHQTNLMSSASRRMKPQLDWPKPNVQAEWSLLSRYIEEPACLGDRTPNEHINVMEMAIANGIEPLLYNRLKTSNALDGLTGLVKERLQRVYLQTAAFNLFMSSEIPLLFEVFGGAKIPVLWVKGIILAEAVYGNFALRPSGDLDVIVKREDIGRAEQVIGELGYSPVSPEAYGNVDKEIDHARTYRRKENEALGINPNKTPGFGSILVESH